MILVIDQQGFTTNILVHQLGAVHTVTAAELAALNLHEYTHAIITHGPKLGQLARFKTVPHLPVLAIGSAYQQLAAAYGHTAVGSARPVYGQPVAHHHGATKLFEHLPHSAEFVSYHPWRLIDMDPDLFSVQAVDHDDAVLAYRINDTNHWGMHADPAALLSTHGATLLQNFLTLAQPKLATGRSSPTPRTTPHRVPLLTRTVAGELNTPATFRALQRDATAAFWLDSAAAHRGQGTTSIMGTNAGPLAQTVRWDAETNQLDIHQNASARYLHGDILTYLNDNTWQCVAEHQLEGFTGGWVGYLGYEAQQATLGRPNRWQASTPDAYWILPQAFLRYDHVQHITTLCAVGDATFLDELEDALVFDHHTAATVSNATHTAGNWRLSASEYQDRIHRIQTMLEAGQAAGICLTDTFELHPYSGDGLALYERLRRHNPAPYAGYFRFTTFGDELEILSASPEKFLSIDATGMVESKPIKGTVARSNDPGVDAERAESMATDAKIQSENLMITDLLRDDLAKVTVPGSVQVPNLMAVETFVTVHQLVTTVTGQLLPEALATDALRALFPGGSMTGAPKLASLEALEGLEAGPRGIYSGAMGWLGGDNTAEFNVIIRTIVIADGHLSIGAGGAIVVDSDPVAEEHEKQLKAQALLEQLTEQA